MAFNNRKGFGRETGYIYRIGELKDAHKQGKLFAPHIEKNVSKARPVVEKRGVDRYLKDKYGNKQVIDVAASELAASARSFSSYFRKEQGSIYHYTIDDVLRTLPKKYTVLSEVTIDGFDYDNVILYDKYRIDIEVSKDPYRWVREPTRHMGRPFFFITTGYGLNAKMIAAMAEFECYPVFTLGCACKGPISIDQFLTEVPTIFAEAEMLENAEIAHGSVTRCHCNKV